MTFEERLQLAILIGIGFAFIIAPPIINVSEIRFIATIDVITITYCLLSFIPNKKENKK